MKPSTPAQWALRAALYVLGLFFLALGVALSINSDLGVSPVNSLPYVLSRITGGALSLCVIAVYGFYILLQAVLLGRAFRPINLLELLFSTLFGYFVDFAKTLVGDFRLPWGYAGQLGLLALSILVIALGVALYIEVDLVPMPMEGLSMALAERLGAPFHTVKIWVDCAVVALAVGASLIFLGGLDGIREGTVLTALVVGRVMALVRRPLTPIVRSLCLSSEVPQD